MSTSERRSFPTQSKETKRIRPTRTLTQAHSNKWCATPVAVGAQVARGTVIGADFDIAREPGLALLPKASQSRLETQHLANALATKNHPE